MVAVLYVWLAIDHGYGHYLLSPPPEKAISFVVAELMTIFQISLAMLTFVIGTFGFSFAPNYIERYCQQNDDDLLCLMDVRGIYRVSGNGVRVHVDGGTTG